MKYNIDFDLCAIIIFVITIFFFYFKKNIPSPRNRIFGLLLWVSLFATIFDILAVFTVSYGQSLSNGIKLIPHILYYLLHISTPFLFFLYVVFLTETPKTLSKRNKILFYTPFLIQLTMIFINPITKWVFYYSENVYSRGKYQYVLYIITAFYLFMGTIHVWKNKAMVSSQVTFSVFSFVVISAIPIGIQITHHTLLLECFGSSICILLILLTLHNNDDLIDSVSGLLNRTAFSDSGVINFQSATPFSVLIVKIADCDLMRRTFGIEFMNKIVKEYSKFLSTLVPFGTAFYLEDECFALTFSSDVNDADHVREKIERRSQSAWTIDYMSITIPAYICRLDGPSNINCINSLFEYIDFIKEIKGSEKTNISVGEINLSAKTHEDDIQLAINQALASNSLQVYYQPIYSVKHKKIVSVEALVRLIDPVLGMLSPEEFIPIAERNGTILKIDEFVFKSVCKFIFTHDLDKLGLEYVELNLSAIECMQTEIVDKLVSAVRHHGISANKICLEITETAAWHAPEILKNNINKLVNAGFSIAMDDYGMGYSNIRSMLDLPFKFIKLDKGLVWSAFQFEKAKIALESTVQMIFKLDMEIIAEGIETKEQAEFMISIGCNHLQGFYYSRPVPEQSLIHLLTGASNYPMTRAQRRSAIYSASNR